MDWTLSLPFVFYAFRAVLPVIMAGIPRNHPWREMRLVVFLLAGITMDLVDGVLARWLRITGWNAVYWGDHGSDIIFFLGAIIVIGGKFSWAKDLPPPPPRRATPEERRRERIRLAAWITMLVLLAGMVFILIFERAVSPPQLQ
jgi:hypothetical protein